MTKKNLKKLVFCLSIILLGGIGGVLADKYIFPYLSSSEMFSRYEFLKKTNENVTIINKTEQVTIKEDVSISKVSNQIVSTVVNIVSYDNSKLKTSIKNGTGVIISSDGMIMTYVKAINLEDSKYKILVDENNSYDAELVGVDTFSNLAFLKIEANNLPSISFSDPDDLNSGRKVIAIGNSDKTYGIRYSSSILGNFNSYFNLSESTAASSEKLEGVFMSDFISGANLLGGPVIDYAGQVIGIIGSIEKNNKELFFEIPSRQIKLVIDRVLKNKLDEAPELGVEYQSLSKTDALTEEGLRDKGAKIISSKRKTALKLNDIIISIDDKEINEKNSLSNILYSFKIGDEIALKVIRNEKEIEIKVQL